MSALVDPTASRKRGRLFFLAPGDVLKGRVEPIIWMRMCEHFAAMGLRVELLSLYAYRRENVRRREIFDHFGVERRNFSVRILPTPRGSQPSLVWNRLCTLAAYSLHATSRLLAPAIAGESGDVYYARSFAGLSPYLVFASRLRARRGARFVLETHVLPKSPSAVRLAQRADGIVVSSQRLRQDMMERLGIPEERLHVAYLAANVAPCSLDRASACRELGLPEDKRYLVYTGKLVPEEVRRIIDAAAILREKAPDAVVLFVGGNPKILDQLGEELSRRGLDNVRFEGFVAPSRVALYQKAASALVLYLTTTRSIIEYITPSKLFDYLQAERPIVASDYPILKEIVQHGSNAMLVEPENPSALAAALECVLKNDELAGRLACRAAADAKRYTWKRRVEGIWRFIDGLEPRATSRRRR